MTLAEREQAEYRAWQAKQVLQSAINGLHYHKLSCKSGTCDECRWREESVRIYTEQAEQAK